MHIMLHSATTCSTIPNDSYPIEQKTKTNFILYPLQVYLQCKTKTIQLFLIQIHIFQHGVDSLLIYLTQQQKTIISR